MSNDEDLLNLSKRIIEKIERSMADRTSYFKESEEERNEMCEAMEKLIKEERSEERAETRLEMAISTATKMIKSGKGRAATEGADRKLANADLFMDTLRFQGR